MKRKIRIFAPLDIPMHIRCYFHCLFFSLVGKVELN